MAEERLIDDDKDKKYRIKVNADGEEELVIEEGEEEQTENVEEVAFEAPEQEENDEEAAVMTPEQYALKREQERIKREEMQAQARELISKAAKDCESDKLNTALEYLEQAEELDETNGDIYALRMRAYTRDFTDYTQVEKAAESADSVKNYTSAEVKQTLQKKAFTSLDENIASLRAKVKALNAENEEKKAERAVRFKADRKKAVTAFAFAFVAFVASCLLCGYFASIIYTVSTGNYLILTCVFAGISFILLIALAFAARYLNITCRRVRLNNRNTSTSLGRELLEKQAQLKAFIAIRDCLKAE